MRVCDNIRALLSEEGRTQIGLAEFVGTKPATVNAWANRRCDPEVRYIPRIAKWFNVPLERLFEGVE